MASLRVQLPPRLLYVGGSVPPFTRRSQPALTRCHSTPTRPDPLPGRYEFNDCYRCTSPPVILHGQRGAFELDPARPGHHFPAFKLAYEAFERVVTRLAEQSTHVGAKESAQAAKQQVGAVCAAEAVALSARWSALSSTQAENKGWSAVPCSSARGGRGGAQVVSRAVAGLSEAARRLQAA